MKKVLSVLSLFVVLTTAWAQDCIPTAQVMINANDRSLRFCPCVRLCPGAVVPIRVCGANLRIGRPPLLSLTPGCSSFECFTDCTPVTAWQYDPNAWVLNEDTHCWENVIIGQSAGCLCVCFERYLAVDLRAFTAVPGDGEITLRWTTAAEQFSRYFQVVRDGNIIAQIEAAGNSETDRSYSFGDRTVVNGIAHHYELYAVDDNGTRERQAALDAAATSGNSAQPENYALYQNLPNPFNPTTTISFDLVESGFVTLTVYDMLGREVAALVNSNLPAGRHLVTFDGHNLPSAMYLYRLTVNGFSEQKKMLLLK